MLRISPTKIPLLILVCLVAFSQCYEDYYESLLEEYPEYKYEENADTGLLPGNPSVKVHYTAQITESKFYYQIGHEVAVEKELSSNTGRVPGNHPFNSKEDPSEKTNSDERKPCYDYYEDYQLDINPCSPEEETTTRNLESNAVAPIGQRKCRYQDTFFIRGL